MNDGARDVLKVLVPNTTIFGIVNLASAQPFINLLLAAVSVAFTVWRFWVAIQDRRRRRDLYDR